ncbi:trace amine-associated receptor 4-like [Sphaerodactylus townsendi]|uniref:trace amine-associated receptor 4-like n=1 Tax=Sphaerodactylus townsendi TaxID=933632 RepID=UPI00202681FC|nr:trace amine-associated receptor 4-like [Sphaerodactylus townsendi]
MLGNCSSSNCTLGSQGFAGSVGKLVLMVFLIVAISLGNTVILLVFLHARNFRSPQGYLKASLALADLSIGVIVVPYSVYREVNKLLYGMKQETGESKELICYIIGPLFAVSTFVSITTIFLLSVERSIAVLKPLHKRAVVTKRRTAWLTLITWALSLLLAVIPMIVSPDITFQYNSCSSLCNYVLPTDKPPQPHWNIMLLYPVFDFSLLGSTLIINLVTFAALHQYCKTRKQLGGDSQRGTQLSFSEINAAKTIGVLTFAFAASFSPIAVFVVGSVVGFEWCHFSFYAFWILTSNSCWNVAIYSAWDPKFRQGVKELFGKRVLKSTSQGPSHSVEVDSTSAACVVAPKEMFHPDGT